MRMLRALLLVAVVVTFLVVLCIEFVSGRATHTEVVLLAVLIGAVYLLSWPPMRVRTGEPGRAPVTGAVLIAVAWMARMTTAITLALLIAGHARHLAFDPQIAAFVLVGGLLGLVLLLGSLLAGVQQPQRSDWLRSLVNIPIAMAIGGFAQPLKVAAFYLLCWVPLWVYHGVADGTGARWFGVLVVIPVWPLWLGLVFFVVARLRRLLNRVLGPTNPISAWLGELKAEGEGVKAEVRTEPQHTASVSIAPGLSKDWDPDATAGEPVRHRAGWRRRKRR
ncbi:hypothetical protein [Amycolatopsis sp. FDAARGOS 1241]|uniref:hypothetical protein n=1 Tax=Amycolatopsis sp. FDAARGOS 1241 TaxID=2778070 RepID=UPI001951CC5B|nr:hypothetical protein [Amycolatopsis sp. FDAARGOS 1241]QRP45634.1 hypothetical protein I6J71_42110 [Amycolatopsis sp. FDAARGOS 1241]